MKPSKTLICLAAGALLFTAASNTFAGTMTPTAQPSFSPANVVTNNSIMFQQATPSVVKIFGNATITPGAGAHTVTLSLSGNFTSNANDLASFAYNFNINLMSATPATFQLSLQVNPTGLPSFSASQGAQTVAANSNQAYSGRAQSPAAPFGGSGTFTGTLQINFGAGTTASDQMILTIPQNSIDFAVQPTPIPEPSTYALLALGVLGLALHARRKAATA
jgi:hypothetical protein